jgi:hypothetical protein
MGDYDDERPSWREIDKRRDGSSHVKKDEKQQREAVKLDRWNMGRRKEALEKLFMGEKGTLEHEKLYNKIHKSYGSSTFLPTVQKYVEQYGAPDDTSTLLLLLDTKNVPIMMLTMERLREVHKGASAREKEDIRRKLSILALTDRSADVKEKASEMVEELKSQS